MGKDIGSLVGRNCGRKSGDFLRDQTQASLPCSRVDPEDDRRSDGEFRCRHAWPGACAIEWGSRMIGVPLGELAASVVALGALDERVADGMVPLRPASPILSCAPIVCGVLEP